MTDTIRHNKKHKTQLKTQLDTTENSSLLLHVDEPFLLSWGHQPLLVLYSCSQGFLLHGKSTLSSDWVVRGKKRKKMTKSGKISNQYLCLYETWKRLSMSATARGYGVVHLWGTGQAEGWCMCAPCFLFVSQWAISELQCSRPLFQSGAKCEAIK